MATKCTLTILTFKDRNTLESVKPWPGVFDSEDAAEAEFMHQCDGMKDRSGMFAWQVPQIEVLGDTVAHVFMDDRGHADRVVVGIVAPVEGA